MRALEGRRFMWEDNIKTDLTVKGGGRDRFIWLRVGKSDGLL
jgi:hypothetical protein